MASYRKRGTSWQASVYVNGVRDSATRKTKAEAVAWATAREAELTGKRLPDHTVGDALEHFGRDVSPSRKGAKWELLRIGAFARDPLASVRLPSLSAQDLASWRDRRLKSVAAGSVRREFNVLRAALRLARLEWGWLREDVCSAVKMPIAPPSRKRRIPGDQIERICAALGLSAGLVAETTENRIGLAFLFALETAMRAGEILGMTWADVREKSVTLPRTKNGDVREVPLSMRAREILAVLRARAFGANLSEFPTGCADRVFDINPSTRDTLFRRAVKLCEIDNLHFHDSRAEAIWRLSKKLGVMDLARVIGHRDLKSLMIYYNASADSLADML